MNQLLRMWVTKGIWCDLGALAAGAVLPLAFAPFGIYPVAVVALIVLFSVWLAATPRRALWRGYLFGVGMFGTGVTWVHVSIHEFGGVPLSVSVFITVLFVAFLSLFPALAGYAVAKLRPGLGVRTVRAKLLLLVPGGWLLSEWVRGWFLTGFPWLAVGYSQTDSPLRGWAPVAGVYGVSLAVALTAAWLLFAMTATNRRWRLGAVGAAAVLWAAGEVLSLVQWTDTGGEPLRVTLVQGNISQDMKWRPEMRDPTLDLYSRLSEEAGASDLIVWPETALPDFYHRSKEFLRHLESRAAASGTDYLIGVLYLDTASQRYYNSMVSIGGSSAFYHKQHLVPFTEYLPLKSLLGPVVAFMNVPMSDFSAGASDQPLVEVAGYPVGISICFEDAFGEEVIRTLPEAAYLVNVSNDAWFGTSSAPHQHLQMARMRAIETERYMLRATNTGVSAVIGPEGELQSVAPQFEPYALSDEIVPRQGATPYVLVGNWLAVALAAFIVVLGLWWPRRSRADG